MENFEIKKLQKLNNWSIKIKMENLCIFRTELIQNNDKYSHYIGTHRLNKQLRQERMIRLSSTFIQYRER